MVGTSQTEDLRRAVLLSRWLTVIGFLAVAAILVSMIVTLCLAHGDATYAAARASENVLMFVTREVKSSVDAFEGTLQDLREAIQSPQAAQLSPEARRTLLTTKAERTKYIGAIGVVDADGTVRESSRTATLLPINVADRDYFTVQRETPTEGLYISRPFESRSSGGAPSVAVTLPRSAPDGSFGGIVMGLMKLAYLRDLMNTAQLGPRGRSGLFRADGLLLVRNTGSAQRLEVGQDQGESPVFRRFQGKETGTFDATSPSDGQRRRYAFNAVPGLPLVVAVSMTLGDIYEQWNRRALGMVLVTSLACLAIIALTTLFRRELVRRAQAEAALSRIATVDALTGIANRRRFDERLEREWRRAGRTGGIVGLLMIDVDGFKAFNDKNGHWMGDELLVQIARRISATLTRPGDFVARYGGEEFAVVLPDTDLDGAREIAERIRAAVEVTTVADPAGRPLCSTVSIGACAVQPDEDIALGEMIRLADSALYAAKDRGRNMVATRPAPPRSHPPVAVAS